jgi:hypothetical protein
VPSTTADTPPEPKSEPLMIELQGNRYVRFGGRQQSAERGVNAAPDYADAEAAKSSRPRPQTQPEIPPTVLIFRDGHREQVPEYTIVGRTLYASGKTSNSLLSTFPQPRKRTTITVLNSCCPPPRMRSFSGPDRALEPRVANLPGKPDHP